MSKVRTRKRGKTWSYAFEAGRTEDGKRKVVERGGFSSRDEAYEAGAKAFTDWKHGNIGITNERVTLKVFLENWLTNVCATNVKTGTLASYRSQIHTHIIPALGGLPLADLTPARLDAWMRGLAKEGLSRGTLRLNLAILGGALSYAVYPAELIASNPTHYIKIPKSAPAKVIKRKIIPQEQALTLFHRFLISSPCVALVILLLYHTGMRVSEVLGLVWGGYRPTRTGHPCQTSDYQNPTTLTFWISEISCRSERHPDRRHVGHLSLRLAETSACRPCEKGKYSCKLCRLSQTNHDMLAGSSA